MTYEPDAFAGVRDADAFRRLLDTAGKRLFAEAMSRLQLAEAILGLVAEIKPRLESPLLGWASGNLDDLQALDGAHWTGVDHDRFLADPQGTVERLGDWAGWGWDRDLGGVLPLSRYTLTTPAPDKWRKHASDIEPRLAAIQATVDRALRAAG